VTGVASRSQTWLRHDLLVAATVFTWITVVLVLDSDGSLLRQRILGALTWALLVALLHPETRLVKLQVAVVVAFASAIEYTFSPLLEVYVYRFHNVPLYVPPGHGLVYLCALALGRSALFSRFRRQLWAATFLVGGAWALHGAFLSPRPDVLGLFWFTCLAGFLLFGRVPTLYVGAFLIVSYLELVGTSLHTWTWQPRDPTGWISIGNPPSGAAGGYGWFDLTAALLAPRLVRRARSRRPDVEPERLGDDDGLVDADDGAGALHRERVQ
jgi:hypothetical protein